MRAAGELSEAARHPEQENTRDHRDHRGKTDRRERHVTAASDWSKNQPDNQTTARDPERQWHEGWSTTETGGRPFVRTRETDEARSYSFRRSAEDKRQIS